MEQLLERGAPCLAVASESGFLFCDGRILGLGRPQMGCYNLCLLHRVSSSLLFTFCSISLDVLVHVVLCFCIFVPIGVLIF